MCDRLHVIVQKNGQLLEVVYDNGHFYLETPDKCVSYKSTVTECEDGNTTIVLLLLIQFLMFLVLTYLSV